MGNMTLEDWGRLQIGAGLLLLGSLWYLFSGITPDLPKENPPNTIVIPVVPLDSQISLVPTPGSELQVEPNKPIDLSRIFTDELDPPQQLTIHIQRDGFEPLKETLEGNEVLRFKTWKTFPKDGSTIVLKEGETGYLLLKLTQRWPTVPLALLGLVGFIFTTRRKTVAQKRLKRLQKLEEKQLEHPYSGTRVEEYRITDFIGEGGMADVYKLIPDKFLGTPEEANEALAIKICKNIDPKWQKRFFQELQVSEEIDHPNALKIFKSGYLENQTPDQDTKKVEDLQRPYLIMEYLEGDTIHDLTTTENVIEENNSEKIVVQHHTLPAEKIVEYLTPAVEALQHAHDNGIVHRDVTPKNILITKEGVTKLLDFGISKILANKDLMMTTEGFGTPAYLSPEQLLQNEQQHVDGRTDQFAVGALIYQLLTGTAPHGEDHLTVFNKLLSNADVTPLRDIRPDCDPGIAEVVEKMLNADREERYPSVKEAFQAFVKAVERSAS